MPKHSHDISTMRMRERSVTSEDFESASEDFQLLGHKDSLPQKVNQPTHAYWLAKIPLDENKNFPE
jgi:hypothetical protein